MDQQAWSRIYADLEREIAERTRRGARLDELAVIIGIDRARFAMDRGDTDEAIALIQDVRRHLGDGGGGVTRGTPASPTVADLDAIEDELHGQTRLGSARLEIVGEDEEDIPLTRGASQNTKVAKSIKIEDIKDEYLQLWGACKVRPDRAPSVRREADRLLASRKVYEEISERTKVPWWFIGLLHQMECSFSLAKHLHNGDSLGARTWQVPAGRPKDGSPPFIFADSASDALEVDGFAGKTDWELPVVLWRLERYNGFGYRRKYGFASPYLWSYTNHFTAGKYVKDGVFDPNAPSKQCGTCATLRDLLERGLVAFEEKKPEVIATVPPKPTPPPVAAPPEVSPPPKPAESAAVATGGTAATAKPEAQTAPHDTPAVSGASQSPASAAEMPPVTKPSSPASAQPATAEPVPAAAPAPAQPDTASPALAPELPPAAPTPVATPAAAPAVPASPASVGLAVAASTPPGPNADAPGTTAAAGQPPAVSAAVAAALAELAKRGK